MKCTRSSRAVNLRRPSHRARDRRTAEIAAAELHLGLLTFRDRLVARTRRRAASLWFSRRYDAARRIWQTLARLTPSPDITQPKEDAR